MARNPRLALLSASFCVLGLLSCSTFANFFSGGTSSTPEPATKAATPSLSPIPPQAHSTQIAFISSMDNPEDPYHHSDIFLINEDGSGLVKLTDNLGYIGDFAWSPDGERIVFGSSENGDYELYVMNADGSGITRLTNNSKTWSLDPSWSPDGQYLVYSTWDIDKQDSIHIMHSDGTGDRLLAGGGRTPSWSPDGSKIAFAVSEDGIYVIDPDGQNKTRLLDSKGTEDDSYPRWSPDGKRILYASDPLTQMGGLSGNVHVYVMNPDGSEVRMLSDAEYCIPPFAWSPDGQSIAFARDIHPYDKKYRMFLMSADGSNVRPLFENIEGEQPAWRP